MTIDATREQRTQLQAFAPGKLALVKFLVIKDQDAYRRYRSASERSVREAGGKHTHCLRIDQILAGGDMPYGAITVDVFPSSETALCAFDAVRSERQSAFSEIYALIVRPRPALPRFTKGLGLLGGILSRLLGTRSERALPEVY